MEFEVLSREIEWKCKRVAAAFGTQKWKQRRLHKGTEFRFDSVGDHFRTIWWISHVPPHPLQLKAVIIENRKQHQDQGEDTWLNYNEETLQYELDRVGVHTGQLMARGLYRLGIEDEEVFA